MGELYSPFPKLPKNIRQIGERDQMVRLYMEDYVNTYLKRLYPKGGQDLRVGLLLGSAEEHDGIPYLFADGAMEMEDVTEDGEKVVFSEGAWKKAYESVEQLFPKRVVLGWFLCGAPGCQLSPLNYWKQHGQYFAGKNQLMYLNSGLEGEEAIYITSEDGFYKLQGHCIYYERNQMMQDYMILRKDTRRVETGTGDTVIRDFRQRMEDNKVQVAARRSTISVLGGLCSVLSIAVLAGGVVIFNNYEKMQQMESVLASVMPSVSSSQSTAEEGADSLLVEEAKGQVYPTIDAESMSETMPETGTETVRESEGRSSAEAVGEPELKSGSEAAASTEHVAQAGAGTETGGKEEAEEDVGIVQEPDKPDDVSPDPKDSTQTGAVSKGTTYIVQDGETLYGICLKFYHSLKRLDEVCEVNGLENVDKIIAGQKLILPK